MKLRSFFSRCLLVLALSTFAFAKGGITTIPLTTNITDLNAQGVAYDVQSDGLGPYLSNVNAVTTFLTSNGYNHIQFGDWQFDTYSSTVRMVNLSLDTVDAVQPGDPHYTAPANPPFWGTKLVIAHIEDKCTFVNKDMLTMTAGNAFTCPLIIRFPATSRTDYRIYIAPSFTGYAETTDVQVSCNSADSGGCNDWFIDPIPVVNPDGTTSPGRAVGRLELDAKTVTNDGDFYITFHFHLTRP
jgi:hypothetical protein